MCPQIWIIILNLLKSVPLLWRWYSSWLGKIQWKVNTFVQRILWVPPDMKCFTAIHSFALLFLLYKKVSKIYVSQQLTRQCFGWVWKLDTATSDYKVHIHMKHFLLADWLNIWSSESHTLSVNFCTFCFCEKALSNQFSEARAGQSQQSSLSTDSLSGFEIACE